MKRCSKCILPENYPGISFNKQGICSYCLQEGEKSEVTQERKKELRVDLEKTIKECRGKGRDYDCVVSLSGGKDSAHLAYLMKREYKLRVLTFTVDIGFMSKRALDNVKRIVHKLDVDHILFKPRDGFYNKLFSFLFTHMSAKGCIPTICFVCGPVTDGIILKVAVEKNIPLIFHGYGPNQPPDTHYFYEFPRYHFQGDGFTPNIFQNDVFGEEDRNVLWNYDRYKEIGPLPRVLMPLHVLDYDEDEVTKKVEDLGLIAKGKASPMVTNCLLNWPMIYFQTKKLGYNPYIDFFSDLIRAGKASRRKWLLLEKIMAWQIKLGIFKRKEIRYVLNKLNISEEDVLNREWD